MDRRDFLQLGMVGGIAGVMLSRQSAAADSSTGMAGGVYYTKDNPGRWAKKVGSHLPTLEKQVGPDGDVTVKVTTKHGQHGFEHYIVKHQLLDQNYRFIAEKMFDPDNEEAESAYTLPAGYQGMVYAISLCNKHDLWLNGMEI